MVIFKSNRGQYTPREPSKRGCQLGDRHLRFQLIEPVQYDVDWPRLTRIARAFRKYDQQPLAVWHQIVFSQNRRTGQDLRQLELGGLTG
jgi:hypothetical protein